MAYRYITNRFEADMKSTMGADIVVKNLMLGDDMVRLQIWDFGGEPRFRDYLPLYAHGAMGGIFMYDITRNNTLDNVEEWISIFQKGLTEMDRNVPILLVGGKLDLQNERQINDKDVKNLIKTFNFYNSIECSAKTSENVELLFQKLTYVMMKNAGYC